MTLEERIEANANQVLWCVHVAGPDDIHAERSHTDAVAKADRMNRALFAMTTTPGDVLCFAYADIWPYSRESHAASLNRAIICLLTGFFLLCSLPFAFGGSAFAVSRVGIGAFSDQGDVADSLPPFDFGSFNICGPKTKSNTTFLIKNIQVCDCEPNPDSLVPILSKNFSKHLFRTAYSSFDIAMSLPFNGREKNSPLSFVFAGSRSGPDRDDVGIKNLGRHSYFDIMRRSLPVVDVTNDGEKLAFFDPDFSVAHTDIGPQLAFCSYFRAQYKPFSRQPQKECRSAQNKSEESERNGPGGSDGLRGPFYGTKPMHHVANHRHAFPLKPALVGLFIAATLTVIVFLFAWLFIR